MKLLIGHDKVHLAPSIHSVQYDDGCDAIDIIIRINIIIVNVTTQIK
jgi:hypothetical protein